MSKKGFVTLILGGSALLAAGVASSSSAGISALVPIINTPVQVSGGSLAITRQVTPPNSNPTRPPGRSLYRPGPRNPPTVLE